jgi:hypothetical protein
LVKGIARLIKKAIIVVNSYASNEAESVLCYVIFKTVMENCLVTA